MFLRICNGRRYRKRRLKTEVKETADGNKTRDLLMDIHFHPNAAAAFNQKASDLLPQFGLHPELQPSPNVFRPEVFIAASIDRSEMLDAPTITLGTPPIALFVERPNGLLGLSGEPYQAF